MKSAWLLTTLVAALLLVVAPPAVAGAPFDAKQDRTPTLLWRAFPLQERPAAATSQSPSIRAAETRSATPSPEGKSFPLTMLLGLLAAAIAAMTLLLLAQQLVPAVRLRRRLGGGPHRSWPVRAPDWVRWPRRRSRTSSAAKPSEPAGDELLDALRPQPASKRKVKRKIEKVVPMGRLKALPVPAEPEPASDPLPAQPGGRTVETCYIKLWRGYVKSQLYAVRLDEGRTPSVGLAFSPFFRVREEETPTRKADAALRTLIERLEGDGWEVVSSGPRWYQLRLERPRSS
jgi:hypothetical protein